MTKYNSDGKLIWGKQILSQYNFTRRGLVTDTDNNIYLMGNFRPEVNFHDTLYDLDGNFLWARNIDCTSSINGIDMDSNKNIYLTGHIRGLVTLDGKTYPPAFHAGSRDFYVTKIEENPSFIQEQEDQSGISLYPNQARETVKVEIPESVNLNGIKIFSVDGRLMKAISCNKKEMKINLSNLSSGQYILMLVTDKGNSYERFVIVR